MLHVNSFCLVWYTVCWNIRLQGDKQDLNYCKGVSFWLKCLDGELYFTSQCVSIPCMHVFLCPAARKRLKIRRGTQIRCDKSLQGERARDGENTRCAKWGFSVCSCVGEGVLYWDTDIDHPGKGQTQRRFKRKATCYEWFAGTEPVTPNVVSTLNGRGPAGM